MYSNFVSINEQFKNSVNIEYDLMDYDKLAEYIPTEDICEVLGYYLNSIKDSKVNRATLLEGPYGKGKSYLVLALTQLLSLDLDNQKIQLFLNKLKEVDPSTYNTIFKIKKNNFKLLPIVINSNYGHLQQALNIALKEALSRIGLDNLYPDTVYEVCLNVIKQWEKDNTISKKVKENCLSKVNDTLGNIKKGLKNYDSKSLNKFVQVYNCVVNGLEFNPFVNDDVIKNYKDIAHKLKDYGYNGIFIVFDEFSKFIDGDGSSIASELKILQDLAEAVNRSGHSEQMHLCCITHKSLESYYRNKKETEANAFKTVEGRFKEIRFNRSINQNYEIISYALNKKDGFDIAFNNFKQKHIQFYSDLKSLELFDEINEEVLYKGCFPLNPLTTYSVINISERIAQNERTLFTFISDNDSNSLSTFINNNDDGLFNVDKIYDYFSNLIEKTDDDEIRKLYYKTVTNLSKTGVLLEKRIIKVIAIIKIINNGTFACDVNTITECLNENKNNVIKALNSLVDEKLIKKSAITETYDFAGASSKEIDSQVESFVSAKGKINNISTFLNELFVSNFALPRRYNTVKKMTRFYKEEYITDFELLKLRSFKVNYQSSFCDGLILRVINTGVDKEEITDYFKKIRNNEAVVLKLSNTVLSDEIAQEIYRIMGLKKLISKNKTDEVARVETEIMLSDEVSELEAYLNELYSQKKATIISLFNNGSYNELLSNIMFEKYPGTPVINNEMINKEFNVSMNYIKARNEVVNSYLNNLIHPNQENLEGFSTSSPENTVYISSKEKDSQEKREVLEVIKSFFVRAENNRLCSTILIDCLQSAPYGIRSGVIPLLIAMAIDEMDMNIIFYIDNREIDLNADNINKMIINPAKYFFLTERGTVEKINYLKELLNIFGIRTKNSYREDLKQAVAGLQRWVMSMPRVVRTVKANDNYLNVDQRFIETRNLFFNFNINENATIFEKLPRVYNNNYDDVINNIKNYINLSDIVVNNFAKDFANRLKSEFDANENSSLFNAIENWIEKNSARQRILEDKEKNFVKLFDSKNYDDVFLLNDISKNIVNVEITDWENNQSEKICQFINDLKKNIPNRKFINDVVSTDSAGIGSIKEKFNFSPMAEMISNNIEEALEEFGDSVSKEEKINILKNLIDRML